MIGKSILTLLGASIALSNAQISSGPDGTTTCTGGGPAYCADASLTSNIIIRCSGTKGQPGNCNDNLVEVTPEGLKTAALCYQTSPTAGDAACSFNGIVYPDTGAPFPIPPTNNNGTNSTHSSTSAALSTATASSIPTAPGPAIPITMTMASIPTAPGLPTGLSTVRTGGGSVPSTGGGPAPPYPIITSTKVVPAPTATAGTGGGASGATGSSLAAGASTNTPSTSPIGSSSSGAGRKKGVDVAFVGSVVVAVVGMVLV